MIKYYAQVKANGQFQNLLKQVGDDFFGAYYRGPRSIGLSWDKCNLSGVDMYQETTISEYIENIKKQTDTQYNNDIIKLLKTEFYEEILNE
jgi:hypothetical protein